MTTHFSSPVRVLRRRTEALARLPKKIGEDSKRTQEQLDLERETLTSLVNGGARPKKAKGAWHLSDAQ